MSYIICLVGDHTRRISALLLVWFFISLASVESSEPVIPASYILAEIESGHPILIDNCIIKGDINFSRLDQNLTLVSSPIRINNSEIEGSIISNDIIFQESIELSHCTIDGDTNFAGSQFNRTSYFGESVFNGNADFRECNFIGNTNFKGSKFNKYALFVEALFGGDASFSGTQFNDDVSFAKSKFNGDAIFSYTLYNNFGDFSNSLFNDTSSFVESQFAESASFGGSKFNGDALLPGVLFVGNIDFRNCLFNGYANFEESRFNGTSDFSSSAFRGDAYFARSIFMGYALFINTLFAGIVDFQDAQFSKAPDFSRTIFLGETRGVSKDLNPVILISSLAMLSLIVLIFTYKAYKRKTIIPEIKESLNRVSKAEPRDVQEIAASQISLLSGYYEIALDQARKSFIVASVAAIIGLIFFLGSIVFLLYTQQTGLAVISVIGAALTEVISGINFYLYNKSASQLTEFLLNLNMTQRFLLANSVCEGLEGDFKQQARSDLVRAMARSDGLEQKNKN